MALSFNFRSSIGGFHREDVVQYIEYMNSKHTTEVNQLLSEMEALRSKLAQYESAPDLREDVSRLQSQLEEANARADRAEQEKAQAQAACQDALAQVQKLEQTQAEEVSKQLAAMELEAYRRAETVERNAKLRAEQLYRQATGTLAQATTQVDTAAGNLRQIADQVTGQLSQLQIAVESSKIAMQDAATMLYSISPEAADV